MLLLLSLFSSLCVLSFVLLLLLQYNAQYSIAVAVVAGTLEVAEPNVPTQTLPRPSSTKPATSGVAASAAAAAAAAVAPRAAATAAALAYLAKGAEGGYAPLSIPLRRSRRWYFFLRHSR